MVSGVDKETTRNVLAYLDLGRLGCDTTERQLRNVLRGADEQIFNALRAVGYYQSSWDIRQQRVAGKDASCWEIDVTISPGPVTTFRAIDITLVGEGKDNPAFQKVLSQLPIKQGTPVHHGHYEQAKKQIQQVALSQGYFDGTFTEHQLEVDRENNTAIVRLVYETGERYRFGEISLSDTPLSKDAVRRYLRIASGDPFDAEKLIQSQSNLINSQYFDQVSIDRSTPDQVSHTVDIDIQLTAKSRYQSTVGAGYSTDLGPKVSYELRNRRFNETGDTYQIQTQFSPVQSQIGFQFQQPGKDPIREKNVWSLGWQREENDTYTSHSYNAEVARIKVMGNNWVRTTSLNLLFEDFNIASDKDDVMFLFPGIHWQKASSNSASYPTMGWKLSVGTRVAVRSFLADASFVQARLDAKSIFPLFGGRVISRGSGGTTFIDDFAKLPATLRFYAGGDNSVRGFDYESLGPKDKNGEVVGGKYLLVGSVEYDHPVYKQYSAAIFYDAGNAFDAGEVAIKDSIGIGARWHSPIGTIRLDLAFPLQDGGYRLHLSMGPDL